jgi:hypothetical protein
MLASFPFLLPYPVDLVFHSSTLNPFTDSRFIVAGGFTVNSLLLFPNAVNSIWGINFHGPTVLFFQERGGNK